MQAERKNKILCISAVVLSVVFLAVSVVSLVFAVRNDCDEAYTIEQLGYGEFLQAESLTEIKYGATFEQATRTDKRDFEYAIAELKKIKLVPADDFSVDIGPRLGEGGYQALTLYIGDEHLTITSLKYERRAILKVKGKRYVGIGSETFGALCEFLYDEARWA